MISVIIPIYNAELYLRRCIDSVLDSTYRDFELILIDDGSTDGSLQICKQYIDDRIKLIVQKNQGVSAARNRGLDECSGEWVVFVDADDVISRGYLALIAGEDADLILFDFARTERELISAGGEAEKMRFGEEYIPNLLKRILVPDQLRENGNVNFLSPWAKAYRKSIIDRCALRFSPELFHGEDRLFNLEYQMKVRDVLYIFRPVYFYHMSDSSLSHRYHAGLSQNHMRLLKEIYVTLEAGEMLPLLEREFYSYVLDNLTFILVWDIFHPSNGKPYHEKCDLCRRMQENRLDQQAIKYNYVCGPLGRRLLVFFFHLKWYRMTYAICRVSAVYLTWKRYH